MKTRKIALVAAILGALLLVAGCALAGFDFDALFADKTVYTDVEKAETIGDLDAVVVKTDAERVIVGLSQDDQAHISYSDCDKRKHLYSYGDGLLSLSIDTEGRSWVDYLNISLPQSEKSIMITLPASFRGSLNISATTGGVQVENLAGLKNLILALTTGDVRVSSCEATEARFLFTTGSLNVKSFRAQTLYTACTTGSVAFDGLDALSLTVHAVSGDTALSNALCDTVDISATTGSITLDALDAQNITLSVVTGDVKGAIACDATEFTIDASTVTGDNNLGAVHFGGQRRLKISATTGNIHITFEK